MDLVILRKYDNPFLANIMLSKLQDAGIECYIKDENSTIVTRAIGGIRLMVKDSDEAEAKTLLEEFEKEFATAVTCPNCGSHRIHLASREGEGTSITGIISSYFAATTNSAEDMYKCDDCGYETRIPASET